MKGKTSLVDFLIDNILIRKLKFKSYENEFHKQSGFVKLNYWHGTLLLVLFVIIDLLVFSSEQMLTGIWACQ